MLSILFHRSHSLILLTLALIHLSGFKATDSNSLALTSLRFLDQPNCKQIRDCFTCNGDTSSNCAWNDGKCLKSQSDHFWTTKWYEPFDICPDHLKICSITSQNTTFFEFSIDQSLAARSPSPIPKNYFCKFQLALDKDILWQMTLFRFDSLNRSESVDIKIVKGGEVEYFDNEALIRQSFLFANNGQNFTSHTTLNIKEGATHIEVYALNAFEASAASFKVQITEQQSSFSLVSNIYTILSSLFILTLCCMCVIGCCKCFMHKGGPIDYDAEEADPQWDADQLRVY